MSVERLSATYRMEAPRPPRAGTRSDGLPISWVRARWHFVTKLISTESIFLSCVAAVFGLPPARRARQVNRVTCAQLREARPPVLATVHCTVIWTSLRDDTVGRGYCPVPLVLYSGRDCIMTAGPQGCTRVKSLVDTEAWGPSNLTLNVL